MRVIAIIAVAALPIYDFATNSIALRAAEADSTVSPPRFVDYPNCLITNLQPLIHDAFDFKGEMP